jgi:hypothetical protein
MPFGSLWLPVIASTVAVFVASFVLHMVLKYHKADVKKLSNEDAVSDALGKGTPSPGMYFIPYCPDPSAMKDPAVQAKLVKGPVAMVTVMPSGMINMGKHLSQWFVFCFLVSFTVAYVARHTLSAQTAGLEVMRITGAVALCAYAFGNFINSIWHGQPWSNTVRAFIDGLVYAVVTAGVFCALWPSS